MLCITNLSQFFYKTLHNSLHSSDFFLKLYLPLLVQYNYLSNSSIFSIFSYSVVTDLIAVGLKVGIFFCPSYALVTSLNFWIIDVHTHFYFLVMLFHFKPVFPQIQWIIMLLRGFFNWKFKITSFFKEPNSCWRRKSLQKARAFVSTLSSSGLN